MNRAFGTGVASLRATYNRFDTEAIAKTKAQLGRLRKIALKENQSLLTYYECLLFLRAHPFDLELLKLVEVELRRLIAFLRRRRGLAGKLLINAGLPYRDTVSPFSHDCVRWLLNHPHCRVTFEEFVKPSLDLNAVVRLTLPLLERNETNAGLSNDELLDALGVRPNRRLAFLVAELSRFDRLPFVKDHLFDALDLTVRVSPTSAAFSTAWNRLPMKRVFYQPERIRQFDADALMNRPLPPKRALNAERREQVVEVVRNAMALTCRETDPATYLDARSLRVFDLDRGLSVAIFGMTHSRQLGLESYVGFTAFKNGLPAAYGGAWLFGARSEFGMNIFEPYRGGESGYMMCQLLRVYRQVFGVRYFEVDAHQFGLDNEEGITTGAFWFYYHYGFRPISASLALLARREQTRIRAQEGYRSTAKTLLRFTESNVALNFGGRVPGSLYEVTSRVTRMVQKQYAGNRLAAEQDCINKFVAATKLTGRLGSDQREALAELALIASGLRVIDVEGMRLLAAMVKAKPTDVYRYQALLSKFFGRPRIKPLRR